ncbi:DNA polymerase epsilon subunit 2 [Bradysia coprophila]|uniref:DNA polymerase epsilon subunit 2 n=1 Tax=Bradysia coprophila TaxID=38358 RepID=UPI00187D8A12|nr:DNA polymerase epsilon subunit 2 [Bradysia coprophila]
MELSRYKGRVQNALKLSGYVVRSEISQFLAQQLLTLKESEREKWLATILNHIQNQSLTSSVIEKSNVELAIRECSNSGLDESETVFSVINAFDVPSYRYDTDRKHFILDTKHKSILPDATIKSIYLTDRYNMLWQRTSRHELFSAVVQGTKSQAKKFQLRRVENLLAASKMRDVVVLGLLTQIRERKLFIEDPTGIVELDLSNAQYHSGLFCEGSFVLVEGTYNDEILKVSGLGFPPPEMAESSRSYFGTANTWGGRSKSLLKSSPRLLQIERSNTDATLVFVSDCWLDNGEVMEKLNMLFSGYNSCPPSAIVLMGSFIKSSENPFTLKAKLAELADVIEPYMGIKQDTDIVFVPSLDDPATANILPRPPLPNCLWKDFQKKVPRAIFATNPCRLQYCTQQIVVCRADLVTKFCRNTIHFPKSGQLEDHFARTLICQGNLTPLCQITLPTYWQFDAALSLYPLPDLVVIGDPSQGFHTTQQGCAVINTGSFPKSKFAFKVYVPSSRVVEDSQIPDEMDE